MDYFKVNESEDMLNKNTSFSIYLTDNEVKEIERFKDNYSYLLPKRQNAMSSILKLIIENTYLYLNNSERYFNKDLNKILEKSYYNDLDHNFVKKLKENSKEYELILELVRNQLLRTLSNRDTEGYKHVQFRLAKNDYNMLRIIAGNKSLNMNDFLSGYLRYFLSLPFGTKLYILTYPNGLRLDRAIKDHMCIIINGIKYKPYKLANLRLANLKSLICFDSVYDSLCEIDNVLNKDIIFTEEYYELNTYEKEVLDAYSKLDKIKITFRLLNNDNKIINNLVDRKIKSPRIIERKHNDDNSLEEITIKYNEQEINALIKANNKNIEYLCFSDNYNNYVKLTEERTRAFKKYKKDNK